jgi:hypothetical protein
VNNLQYSCNTCPVTPEICELQHLTSCILKRLCPIATTEEAFQHILKNLLNLTPESPLWRAHASEDYTSVIDIITMTNEEIDDLTYENDDMKSVSVHTKQKKMLKHILLYHDHQLKIRASKLFEADDWMRVDANAFTTFTATVVPLILRGSAPSSMSVTAVGAPTGSFTSTQVSELIMVSREM